jgi:hypothetical protein
MRLIPRLRLLHLGWLVLTAVLSAVLGTLAWFATGQAAVSELSAVRAQHEMLKEENERLRSQLGDAHHEVETLRADERAGRDSMQTCRESALRAETSAAMVPALQARATQCEAEVAGWREEGGLARIVSDLQREEARLNEKAGFRIMSYNSAPQPETPQERDNRERRDVIDKRINLIISSRACPATAR